MASILLLSDIHGNLDAVSSIFSKIELPDRVFVAGDITNFGSADMAKAVLARIARAVEPECIHVVAGNCDTAAARSYLSNSGYDAEGMVLDLPFATLVAAGGGLRRAGITCFERTEHELRSALEGGLARAAARGGRPVLVLTHTPPFGTNADLSRGLHVGSEALASLMSETAPAVWICGHIHESRCVSIDENTLIVNPGPCAKGYYAILKTQESPDGTISFHAELSQ